MSIAAEVVKPTEKTKKPSTAHLKIIPETKELRERIRAEAARCARDIDRSKPITKAGLQELGEQLLARLELPQGYLGFTMVCISNEFWREQLMAIDFKRRLLLLPHCLKHAEGCPADYDEFGLDCRKCGACSIADFKVQAEDLGYKVLVAEGTPIVLKIIVSGHVDAIVGVACLNVLEKAIDKVLQVGVPALAVPLLSSNCRNTSVDEDWVREVIDLRTEPPRARTRSYVHLMRAANHLFNGDLERLAPRARAGGASNREASGIRQDAGKENGTARFDPLTQTEEIAYDWLQQGGKRFRPFITLASYDALQGGQGTLGEDSINLPDSVRRVALAIEVFHKASLVHDDIEDDDLYRYGRATLHRRHGLGPAINVGDYLIGFGYRLVSRERKELGAACTADILNKLAEAHLKLSEGQGAELLWREARDKTLTPLDALKIYALKTAPAFEAALYAGLRLAGPTDRYDKLVPEFSRHLGVAFQILNDLKDWDGDADNKLLVGQDVLTARPTLLLALALEAASPAERAELLQLMSQPEKSHTMGGADTPVHSGRQEPLSHQSTIRRVRRIFDRAQVFEKAEKLVEKYRARAEAVADDVEPTELRELLYFLVDTALDRQPPPEPEPEAQPLLQLAISDQPSAIG